MTTSFKSTVCGALKSEFSDLATFHVSSALLQSRDTSNFRVLWALNAAYFLYLAAFNILETLSVTTLGGTLTGSSPLQLPTFYGDATTPSAGLGGRNRLFTAIGSISQASSSIVASTVKIDKVALVGECGRLIGPMQNSDQGAILRWMMPRMGVVGSLTATLADVVRSTSRKSPVVLSEPNIRVEFHH